MALINPIGITNYNQINHLINILIANITFVKTIGILQEISKEIIGILLTMVSNNGVNLSIIDVLNLIIQTTIRKNDKMIIDKMIIDKIIQISL